MSDWEDNCIHWRGRILTGKDAHWCADWDDLPVDDTTPEYPCACVGDVDHKNEILNAFIVSALMPKREAPK